MKDCICFLAVALVCAIPIALSGQNWVYEQVEGPGSWFRLGLEVMSSGVICVSYQDSLSGHVWLARKDTAWRFEDMGNWPGRVGRHLVLGPAGKPALMLKQDTTAVYATLTDTGWAWDTVPLFNSPYYIDYLAFDSSGIPSVMFFWDMDPYVLLSATKQGEDWIADSIEIGYHGPGFWNGPTCPTTFVLGSDNRLYNDRGHFMAFTMGHSEVYVETGRPRAWDRVFVSPQRRAYPISMAVGPSSDFAVFYNSGEELPFSLLRCNGDTVQNAEAFGGKARIDSRDIRQIVYRSGVLKHAYKIGGWVKETLPPVINEARAYDFAIGNQDRPLIAFATASGIFLASRDMVGVNEDDVPGTSGSVSYEGPTLVRGILRLPPASSLKPQTASLLDAVGRKVLDLEPGPNDVSRLAPGVYFIREYSAFSGQHAGAVRKVAITD